MKGSHALWEKLRDLYDRSDDIQALEDFCTEKTLEELRSNGYHALKELLKLQYVGVLEFIFDRFCHPDHGGRWTGDGLTIKDMRECDAISVIASSGDLDLYAIDVLEVLIKRFGMVESSREAYGFTASDFRRKDNFIISHLCANGSDQLLKFIFGTFGATSA